MSILGLMENTADIAQTTPDLSALPSTHSERFGAAWDAAQSPDRFWKVDNARAARADKIIDDLHAMTGERLLNPFGIGNTPTADEMRENVGQPMSVIYAKRLEKLRTKTREAKAGTAEFGGLPADYLDVDSIDASIASEAGGRRARDERMSGTGGGVGGYLGSMAGETVSPVGIATAFLPVTRMPLAIAEATIAGFARNVAKEALFQGGSQGLAQSLSTIVDYQTRKQFGTEQTTEQIVEEILSATGGGLLLGGGFRAAHLGILKLASRGVEIPPAVKDAAVMMEAADLYGSKNPLRVNASASEVAQDQAVGAAMVGRAASPDVEVNPTQTLHDAARRLEPELMQRYDAAVAWRDEARAILAPTDETIAMLKKRMADADEAIKTAGPQTQEVAERMGATARMARLVHDDAVERKAAMEAGQAPAVAAEAAGPSVTPQQYESLGPKAGLQDIFTPAEIAPGKHGAKKAFIIDPEGRLIDVSEIGHPEANTRLNEMAGLGREHEGGFHGGDSPLVRIDATTAYGNLSIGVNAYEAGVTAAQKRMIDQIERMVAREKRRGADLSYHGEVSKDYAGAPVGALKDVKIRDRAAPAAARPAETTVSQSLRQQAQMADLELRELIPEINKVMKRAGEEVTAGQRAAEAFLEGADEAAAFARIESKLTPEQVSRVRELQDQIPEYERMRDAAAPEDAPAWQQAIDDFNDELAKIMDLDIAEQAPVKAALKAVQEYPSNPMQAPRTTPEVPPAAARKAPGDSPEDKAVLQQAKAVIDSETIAAIDPAARQKMEQLDIKEREYKTAISCVAGVL